MSLAVEKRIESQHPMEHTNQCLGSTKQFQLPCEWKFDEVCVHNLISSVFTVISSTTRTSLDFRADFFGFIAIKNLVSNESITSVHILFADVHLNLEKPAKDWPMVNKWLIAENYNYKILSWMTINNVLTQIIEKTPRILKIQIFWNKNGPIRQFWAAMRNEDLAIFRLSNESISLIQQPHTQLVQENVLWILTAIICLRWFFSIVLPRNLYLQKPFPWWFFSVIVFVAA